MPRTPEISPATVIGEIRALLIAELMARPAPEPVVLSRSVATILAASLSEQIDRVATLAEGSALADRLLRELHIARAEIERLELQLVARDLAGVDQPGGGGGAPVAVLCSRAKGAIERRHHRPAGRPGGAEIVDLREALAREHRTAGHPVSDTDGGAA